MGESFAVSPSPSFPVLALLASISCPSTSSPSEDGGVFSSPVVWFFADNIFTVEDSLLALPASLSAEGDCWEWGGVVATVPTLVWRCSPHTRRPEALESTASNG
ncbi:unnamed protein product, partial [Ectocarpus sp. 12 AP-2014]